MELYAEQIIQQEDCSGFMVKERQQRVREILKRYKNGELIPEEKEALIQAMKKYRSAAFEESQTRAYNVLLLFYFAEHPLSTEQMPNRFLINKRTVFKDISKGIEAITAILHGVGGLELMPREEGPAFMKNNLQKVITEQLTKDIGQEIWDECSAFFKGLPLSVIEEKGYPKHESKTSSRIREILKRYKQGNIEPGEQEVLMQAMERYKATAVNEKQGIAYNILFSFYLADHPLKAAQISDKYRINQRTVYKYITRGVEDLTEIMHDLKGGE